jgi:hypothetical protein
MHSVRSMEEFIEFLFVPRSICRLKQLLLGFAELNHGPILAMNQSYHNEHQTEGTKHGNNLPRPHHQNIRGSDNGERGVSTPRQRRAGKGNPKSVSRLPHSPIDEGPIMNVLLPVEFRWSSCFIPVARRFSMRIGIAIVFMWLATVATSAWADPHHGRKQQPPITLNGRQPSISPNA